MAMRGARGEEVFLKVRLVRASQRWASAADAEGVRVIEVIALRNGGWRRWSSILGMCGLGLVRGYFCEAGDIFTGAGIAGVRCGKVMMGWDGDNFNYGWGN